MDGFLRLLTVALVLGLARLPTASSDDHPASLSLTDVARPGLYPSLGPLWPPSMAELLGPDHELSGVLRRVFTSHNFTLPQELLDRGMAYKGHASRLWSVFDKLRRGEQVTLLALGGSVTKGATLDWHGQQQQTYLALACGWLRRAFGPGAKLECINAAIGGVQSEFVSVCLQ